MPKILKRVGSNHEKFKKMVTYFNRKDLASFGNYLMSKEREELIRSTHDELSNPLSVEETLRIVHHSDVENWLYQQRKRVE